MAVRNLPDYRLDELKLDPETRSLRSVRIGNILTDGSLTLTIAGASTVETMLLDPDGDLLASGFLTEWTWGTNADHSDEEAWVRDGQKIDIALDDLVFRLVRLEDQGGGSLRLESEDRAVSKLREQKGTRSATRGSPTQPGITRARFVKMLADEAGVPTFIPEVDEPQTIQAAQGVGAQTTVTGVTAPPKAPSGKGKNAKPASQATRAASGAQGINRSANLTVKGQRPTAENYRVAEIGLDVGVRLNAPPNALVALIAAYIDENNMTNHPGGGGSSSGSLQLLSSTASGMGVSALDIAGCARLFFTKGFTGRGGAISLARRGMAPADIATTVQGNAAGASVYRPFVNEARKWVAAFQGGVLGGGITSSTSVTVEKPFTFSRGANEDSWDAIQRLAEEVAWRAFIRKGTLWYVSDDYLRRQASAFTARESKPGKETPVRQITSTIDLGARDLTADLTITANVDRWTALPGMRITVAGKGPADGNWLVQEVARPLWDDTATITCTKPTGKKPEPAPDTATTSISGPSFVGIAPGALGQAQRFYDECKRISDAGGSYNYGGGHGVNLAHVNPKSGLDCSSSTSLALYRAGLFEGRSVALVSGAFSGWGKPGPGKFFTVWAHGGHVYVDLHVPGRSGDRFDTGGSPSSNGPRIKQGRRSHAGFFSRHYPGL